jgi:hypothetical protein
MIKYSELQERTDMAVEFYMVNRLDEPLKRLRDEMRGLNDDIKLQIVERHESYQRQILKGRKNEEN